MRYPLSGAAARRQRQDRDGHQRRGFRRNPLHRLHARLAALLHRFRQGLLAQGARNPRGKPRGQGEGPGESTGPLEGREGYGLAPGEGVPCGSLYHHGDQAGRHQKNRIVRLQQSSPGRHYCPHARSRRQVDRGGSDRWPARNSFGHETRHNHSLQRGRCAPYGPYGARGARGSRSKPATRSSAWKPSRPIRRPRS